MTKTPDDKMTGTHLNQRVEGLRNGSKVQHGRGDDHLAGLEELLVSLDGSVESTNKLGDRLLYNLKRSNNHTILP